MKFKLKKILRVVSKENLKKIFINLKHNFKNLGLNKYFSNLKKPNKKIVRLSVFIFISFLIGLVISIFVYNNQQKDRNSNFEVTFIDSHQAIVFWTTENKTIGFIKFGKEEKSLEKTIYQTSSALGNVHAVVLEDIPLEGIYISLHNESDSRFLFSQTKKIVFDASTYIE